MKRSALVGLLALVPLASVAAETPRINAYTQPHVLRYSSAEDIAGLNIALINQAVVGDMADLTAAWLFRWDKSNRPQPELATVVPTKENGGISADGKTITYHLRKNVRWSDGAPFDADDVKFSFDAMNNPANNVVTRDGFDSVTKVDVPNKSTVVVHLREPYSLFMATFFTSAGGAPCLLPKHILGGLPNINEAPYNNLPVGIGPFKFAKWDRGESVEMVANPLYWRGTPKLHEVIYKIIPDRNTVLTQLQTGELDLWVPIGGAFKPRLEALPNVTVGRHAIYTTNFFDLNVTRPALRERAVRLALRLAVDRVTIREKVAHGVGILQDSVLPAPYPGIAKVPFAAYDIAKANALLDGAGWKRGPDGVRAKAGVRLSLEVASSSGSPDVDTELELIRASWQQIGVEMTVKRYQSSQLFGPYADGGIYYTGKFDLLALATSISAVDGLTEFSCKLFPPKGQNASHYCNPKLEPILDDFKTRYDFASQSRDLSAAVKILAEDPPEIITASREELYAYNKDLKGLDPNNVTFFDNMMNVDI